MIAAFIAVGIEALEGLTYSDNCVNGPKYWNGDEECSKNEVPFEKCFMSVKSSEDRNSLGVCRELPEEYDF